MDGIESHRISASAQQWCCCSTLTPSVTNTCSSDDTCNYHIVLYLLPALKISATTLSHLVVVVFMCFHVGVLNVKLKRRCVKCSKLEALAGERWSETSTTTAVSFSVRDSVAGIDLRRSLHARHVIRKPLYDQRRAHMATLLAKTGAWSSISFMADRVQHGWVEDSLASELTFCFCVSSLELWIN